MPSWCLLSRRQVVLYQRAVNAMAKELAAAEDPVQRQGVVLGSLLRLKQICNHPSLFSGDAVYDAADSGKFGRLAEICQEIASRGERVLVFTQFREMTGPLAAHLETVWGMPGLVLHGGTPVVQRQRLLVPRAPPEIGRPRRADCPPGPATLPTMRVEAPWPTGIEVALRSGRATSRHLRG
jgi:non-specific serine/threonine protein kinase